jgi:uncharacterized membrane protein (UPF0182 family)
MRAVRILFLVFLAVFFVFGPLLATWYTDWLWFLDLGYPAVFWTPFLSRAGLAACVGAAVFLILYLNARPFLRDNRAQPIVILRGDGQPVRMWSAATIRRTVWIGAATLAALSGLANSRRWLVFQQFLHAQPSGVRDPIFGADVTFYMLQFPFYRFLESFLWSWLLFATALVAAAYVVDGALRAFQGRWIVPPAVRAHLSLLGGLLFLVRAAGFRLDAYELMISQRGLYFGPTYADLHARLPALNVLSMLSLTGALLLFANVRLKTLRFAVGVVAFMAIAWLLGAGVFPAAVQQLVVAPNELTRETPYLQRHIQSTRRAFQLDRAVERAFPVAETLPAAALARNAPTLRNVRLWDYRPLLDAYRQLQGLRAYYMIQDVDVDRYTVGGEQRQVMIAAREMDVRRLPPQARNWVNEHQIYTHGYGAVASPVNRIREGGMPELWLRDLPPVATVPELQVERPEIYFGEMTTAYALVGTRGGELDFARGEENTTTRYAGRSGVPLSNGLRRLAFAMRFGTEKIALSSDFTPQTRVLFARTLRERIGRLAPFLRLDNDPYLVVAGGRLFWIADGYTTSTRYPYAQPAPQGPNYIRNAVKVVVDAYHGTVDFYLVDPADPLAAAWGRIFPGLFKPAAALPEALRAHLRYPVDLFEMQALVYANYHMQDPRVFYNREDAWSWPNEIFAGQTTRVEPYYVTMRLPGEAAPEFVLILPMTAQRRDNMVAWLAARNDPAAYGQLLTFRFPKDRVVYGPMQIESRINQDTAISQALTLWNQQGSRVIRGNLLVIPIDDALLYVEPIFLQAEASQLPELKRVIVAHGQRIAMEETLERALARVFDLPLRDGPAGTAADAIPGAAAPQRSAPPGAAPAATTMAEDVSAVIARAAEVYRRAQASLRRGDLGAYQRDIDEVGRILSELERRRSRP